MIIIVVSLFSGSFKHLEYRFDILEAKVIKKLQDQGFVKYRINIEYFLHLRYDGTDCGLMCTPMTQSNNRNYSKLKQGDFATTFIQRYYKHTDLKLFLECNN